MGAQEQQRLLLLMEFKTEEINKCLYVVGREQLKIEENYLRL